MDCFHADDAMLYIAPKDCIDCGACEPQCPVHAIFEDRQLPADKKAWLQINAQRSDELPTISQKAEPLPTAQERKKQLGY